MGRTFLPTRSAASFRFLLDNAPLPSSFWLFSRRSSRPSPCSAAQLCPANALPSTSTSSSSPAPSLTSRTATSWPLTLRCSAIPSRSPRSPTDFTAFWQSGDVNSQPDAYSHPTARPPPLHPLLRSLLSASSPERAPTTATLPGEPPQSTGIRRSGPEPEPPPEPGHSRRRSLSGR